MCGFSDLGLVLPHKPHHLCCEFFTGDADMLPLEILYCDPKGRRALLRVPSTVGRSVCLCWEHSKHKGPKGPSFAPPSEIAFEMEMEGAKPFVPDPPIPQRRLNSWGPISVLLYYIRAYEGPISVNFSREIPSHFQP